MKIFIGSSTEAEYYDSQIRALMESFGATVVHWKEIFLPGDNTLDSLLKISSMIDGALLVVTPDDQTFFRETAKISPRDNILFELGLFISALGKYNAGILYVIPKDAKPATLPTDLHGINFIAYDESRLEDSKQKLRKWFDAVSLRVNEFQDDLNNLTTDVHRTISSMPKGNIIFATDHLRQILSSFGKGDVKIEPHRYYSMLYEEMDNSNKSIEVNAIALLPPEIWFKERAQTKYLSRNIQAANKGVKIRRLFIIKNNPPLRLSDVILGQLNAGIEIRYLLQDSIFIEDTSDLQDTALFVDHASNAMRAYIAESANNTALITSARLIFDQENCSRKRRLFNDLWHLATDLSDPEVSLNLDSLKNLIGPFPSELVKQFDKLTIEVVSCQAAAKARNVPLGNELKSLILETSEGLVAVHVPGDKQVSLRKVKNKLKCKEATLASITRLRELETAPGTVSPFLPKIWGLKHLISTNLLELEYLTTNSGTLTDYIRFSPNLLLFAKDKILDVFEEPSK